MLLTNTLFKMSCLKPKNMKSLKYLPPYVSVVQYLVSSNSRKLGVTEFYLFSMQNEHLNQFF